MALSADRELALYASAELVELGLDDNVLIYKNAFVGKNTSTGYVRPLVAGDPFVGIAYSRADNTQSGHAAGKVRVRLHQNVDIVHTLTSVAVANVGADVYASADGTLTLTSTNNSRIGRVVAVEGTNLARIRCQPVFST